MSPSAAIRWGSGLTSVAAGLLLLLGHIVNLGGDPAYGTVLGETLVLSSHALLVFALVSLWAVQAERSGTLGVVRMALSIVGTTLNCAAVLAEIAGASGADVDPVISEGASGTITLLGGLAFLIGLILFGVATMRAGVLPRWAGARLILGDTSPHCSEHKEQRRYATWHIPLVSSSCYSGCVV